jgi:hypothetical protein
MMSSPWCRVVPGGAVDGWRPRSAVVIDFDPDVVTWTDSDSDCEGTARQTGVAVECGIGGEFGGAEDHLVRYRAVGE